MDLNILPTEMMSMDCMDNVAIEIGGDNVAIEIEHDDLGIEIGKDVDFEIEKDDVGIEVQDVDKEEDEDRQSRGQLVCKPYVGQEFDTIEASKEFWKKYAYNTGFGDRIRTTRRRKVDNVLMSRLYVCSKEGTKAKDKRRIHSKHRADTRCDCGVLMSVSLVKNTRKYRVVSFTENHNHELKGKCTSHQLRAHRNINEVQSRAIDIAVGAGLGPKKTLKFMSLEAGGPENVGYISEDVKSYLRTKSPRDLIAGEATVILDYFQEQSKRSPSFFRDFQLDCSGQITNIFWADSKMLVDYQAFGDVVTFDTTIGTNRETRPLGIFCGFNNHRAIMVFEGCLLFDETAASFAWLFKVFLQCHGEKQPGVIFTDQDAAMISALEIVMPNVRHGLCTWHISQNALRHLAGPLGGDTRTFLSKLYSCMYDFLDIDDFEQQWKDLVEDYELVGNSWIDRIYGKKHQWSLAYMKDTFTAGVRNTQLSESINSKLKNELGCGLTMRKFFHGFDIVLRDVRANEINKDVKSRQTFPYLSNKHSKILRQAAQIYTPSVFTLFNEQFDLKNIVRLDKNSFIDIHVPHERISINYDRKYTIKFDPTSMTISCSCYSYEMCGYLCAHILRVLNVYKIDEILKKYIMKRWTRQAKSGLAFVGWEE